MKILKIVLIVIAIIGILLAGYFGYKAFKQWEAEKYSEISMLKFNQELFLKKVTELSETVTHVVNDTAKTTTTPKPDNTYEELKNTVIELKAEGTASKEEIEKLREELSAQRQAFLASDDTILIKHKEGDTDLLYRDVEGTLQPASENIEKIIEHKDVSEIPIPVEEIINEKSLGLKAGGYYQFDKTYGLIVSKEIISIKEYSLNVSLLSDLKSIEGVKLGGNINYSISKNLELGVGMTIDKDYFICLEYSF